MPLIYKNNSSIFYKELINPLTINKYLIKNIYKNLRIYNIKINSYLFNVNPKNLIIVCKYLSLIELFSGTRSYISYIKEAYDKTNVVCQAKLTKANIYDFLSYFNFYLKEDIISKGVKFKLQIDKKEGNLIFILEDITGIASLPTSLNYMDYNLNVNIILKQDYYSGMFFLKLIKLI